MINHEFLGEVLACDREYYETHYTNIRRHLEHCLLYVQEPTTYDERVILCEVYYFSFGDAFLIAERAKLILPHGLPVIIGRPEGYSRGIVPISAHGTLFFSSLCTRNAYRELSFLAEGRMKGMLQDANDVAAIYAYKFSSRLHKTFQGHELYKLMLSDDEAVYSYMSLHLVEDDNRAKTRKVLAINAELEVASGVMLPVSFTFKSGPILGTLTNVIIGANGVGKTRLLKTLVVAAHRNELDIENDFDDENVSLQIPVVVFTHEKQQWEPLSQRFNHCLSLGAGKHEWSLLGQALQQLYLKDTTGYFVRMAMNLLAQFLDLRRLVFKIPGRGNYRHFSDLINHPNLLEGLNASHMVEYRDLDNNVHQLSSGQRVLVCFIINIVRYCAPRTLVIIDEPENHLHPQFISLIMRALNSALQATESVAVVVTHSPFVVREVEREGVLVLEQHDELPILLRPSLQTLGGDVSLISDYVFGDLHIRKGYQFAIDEALGPQWTDAERRATLNELAGLGHDAASYVAQIRAGRTRE